MGCTSGKPDAGLEEEIANLKLLLDDTKNRSTEQQNLLRFKVEVLVNMLAMEEKKSETTNKRLETLKWLMHSQGVSEQRLTEILLKAGEETEEGGGVSSSSSGNRSVALFDLGGAIARMKEDFELYREDILDALAEKDGKLVANLTAEEFAKQLFVVTDKVSKADISVLSMRFSDGTGNVSIPEFLEFFTTPAPIRAAKAATAAVRMSLDLLQLNGKEDLDEEDSESEDEMEMGPDGKPVKKIKTPEELREEHLIIRSHKTATLEAGVKKLLDLWPIVHGELDLAFTLFEETTEGGVIVTTEVYKKTLTDICGKKSVILRQAMVDAKENKKPANAHPVVDAVTAKNAAAWGKPPLDTSKSSNSVSGGGSRPGSALGGGVASATSTKTAEESAKGGAAAAPVGPQIVPLDEGDIDLLTERFELAGYVHFGHFMQYFRDLEHSEAVANKAAARGKRSTHRLPKDMSGISPFRLSSEWISLRKSAEVATFSPQEVALPPPPTKTPDPTPVSAPAPTPSVKAPSPAPKPATPTVAETKEPEKNKKPSAATPEVKETPAPSPAPPAAAPAAPPAGVEEVKSSGCCGGGAKKPSPAAPVELDPKPAAAENKKTEDKLAVDTSGAKDASDSDSDQEENELKVKKDTKFDTPKGIKKAGFKPKLIEEPTPEPEPEKQSHGSRFHRRADRTFENEKPKNPLDEEDPDEETLYKPKDKGRYK